MLLRLIKSWLLIIGLIYLSSCSSGGGGSSDTPSSPVTADVVEYKVPEIVYNGKTTMMDSTEANMLELSESFLNLNIVVGLTRKLAERSFSNVFELSEKVAKPNFAAEIDRPKSGDYDLIANVHFKSFSQLGVTTNGDASIRHKRDAIRGVNAIDGQYEISMNNVTVEAENEGHWSLTGQFTTTGEFGQFWSGNILAKNLANAEQIYISNLAMNLQWIVPPGNFNTLLGTSYKGSLLLDKLGKVNFTSERLLPLPIYSGFPGEWMIFGIDDGNIEFEFATEKQKLYPFFGNHVAIAKKNQAGLDRWEAVNTTWPDIYRRKITPLYDLPYLIANPGADLYGILNKEVRVHGLHSRSPDSSYLSFDWKFLFVPSGSRNVMVDNKSPVVSFVPDKLGSYILGLTVTDGIHISESSMTVFVATGPDRSDVVTKSGQLEILDSLELNKEIRVSAASTNSFGTGLNLIRGHWYTGKDISLMRDKSSYFDSNTGSVNSFHIPMPGFHYMSYTGDFFDGSSFSMSVGVGPFEISAPVDDPLGVGGQIFTLRDYSGDSTRELLVISSVQQQVSSGELRIYSLEDDSFLKLKTARKFSGLGLKIFVEDFNGDGLKDVSVSTSNSVIIFSQLVDGSLSEPAYLNSDNIATQIQYRSVQSADMNCDHLMDVVALPERNMNQMIVWYQSAAGLLESAKLIELPSDVMILEESVTDWNGDGLADFVSRVSDSRAVAKIYLNQPENGFHVGPTINLNGVGIPVSAKSCDFNKDGITDIIVITEFDLQLLVRTISGEYKPSFGIDVSTLSVVGNGILVDDVDGDGDNDIAVQDFNSLKIGIQTKTGDVLVHSREANYRSYGSEPMVDLLDVNHDGRKDLILPFGGRRESDGAPFLLAWLAGISPYSKPINPPWQISQPLN